MQIARMGRDSTYTPEIAAEICIRLAEGESLRAICRDPYMPDKATVLRWALFDEEFRDHYAHARALQAEGQADELVEIADDGTNDWMEKLAKNGETFLGMNSEHIQRSKLRVDTRKWIAAKLLPKKYGERMALEHSGADGKPLTPQTDPEHAAKLLADIVGRLGALAGGGQSVLAAAGRPSTDGVPE